MAKTFVQGWVRTKSGGSEREPMRPEVLDAPDGVTAAKEYARRHGVRDQDWWNVGPSPRVVIRTEEVESPTHAHVRGIGIAEGAAYLSTDADLANARAAIARVNRVLETGTARANGYREAARRLRGVVASSVVMLRRRFPCTDALTGTLPALINHAARDVELSEQYERRLAEVERERDYRVDECTRLAARVRELVAERDAALAEVDCGQDGVCAKPPGCARHWQERNQELASEVAKLKERSEGLQQAGADLTLRLLGLEKERDEALSSSRAWCEKAAELQAERDCAVARAKDLETALRQARLDLIRAIGDGFTPDDLPSPSLRLDFLEIATTSIDLALHPTPPASASDRTGAEHHDAADLEDGASRARAAEARSADALRAALCDTQANVVRLMDLPGHQVREWCHQTVESIERVLHPTKTVQP